MTATTYMANDLQLAVGTAGGQLLMYDIRANQPILTKDHNYGLPIKKILHHERSDKVFSADQKVVKVWDREDGKPYTSMEVRHGWGATGA